MEILKYGLLSAAGTLVVASSGTLWWCVPAASFLALIAYEHTTPPEQRHPLLQPGGLRRALTDGRAALAAPRPRHQQRQNDAMANGGALAAPRRPRLPPGASLAASAPASVATAPRPAPPPTPAPRPRWLQTINDDPDRAPHALILGPTGAGKTTLATAIMGDRDGPAIVISPKVAPGNWRGAEVITLDDDGTYRPIHQALADLEQEKRDRIVTLRQHGPGALRPLTIVFDELQQLAANAPEAAEFMVSMSSIGRELKVRMIGIGTTDDALNIRGWKASRKNYVRIEMDRDRRATLDDGVRAMSVGTRDIAAQARQVQLRPWRGAPEPGPEAPTIPQPARVAAAGGAGGAPRASTSETAVVVRLDEWRARQAQAAPRVAPVPAPVAQPTPADDLLAELLASAPPPAPPQRQSVTVAQPGGGQVIVNVQQTAEAAAPRKRGPGRRTSAVNVKDRQRRLRRIAYFQDAARREVPFWRAYKEAPAEIGKGNSNEMHAVYNAARKA